MHLYMIRHGQSFVNLKEWDNGNADEGLTDLGLEQADALASWLKHEIAEVNFIYCSTMRRARETCEPLGVLYDRPLHYDDRLREIGNNRLDHTPWPNEELPEYADYWSSERPFSPVTPLAEGGETMMHFRTRVGLFIEELVANHLEKTIVAVCHGGVIDMAFDHVFDTGAWRRCEVFSYNTGISHFQYVAHPKRETWRLHYHNRVDHLRRRAWQAEHEDQHSILSGHW